jgi:iron(III) transport system substrate-binding protein
MKFLSPVLLVLALLAAACAPAAPAAPTTAPAAKATTAPAAAANAEWDALVAAAKREGKVAVMGPNGDAARLSLTEPFTSLYGIEVEWYGASNREAVPRLTAERGAGQYLWDLMVQGAQVDNVIPLDASLPIEPLLVHPDVKDLSKWRGGALEFNDPERKVLVLTPFQRGTVFVNPNNVKPEEITSYKNLLDPKYKGKIISDDPRFAGPGNATFVLFYKHPELGPQFIRDLGKQELTLMRDYQAEVNAVAQGQAEVLIGTADFVAEAAMKRGVPVAIVDPRQLKEGSDVSPANGEVTVFKDGPNPNAAKLYLNWLMSKDGQTGFVKAMGYVSARTDVPIDHTFDWRIPAPGAIKTYTPDLTRVKEQELLPILQEVFGRT